MVAFAAAVFVVGLALSFAFLYRFERRVRASRRLERQAVGRTLRGLIATGALSGSGIGLLGLTGFVWGREAPPGAAAYAWAALFLTLAVLGWPTILIAGFMARVNALGKFTQDD
jgi:hypothetical protein